jgi:hypothetical protein
MLELAQLDQVTDLPLGQANTPGELFRSFEPLFGRNFGGESMRHGQKVGSPRSRCSLITSRAT